MRGGIEGALQPTHPKERAWAPLAIDVSNRFGYIDPTFGGDL
jgi:hypothetical protein